MQPWLSLHILTNNVRVALLKYTVIHTTRDTGVPPSTHFITLHQSDSSSVSQD